MLKQNYFGIDINKNPNLLKKIKKIKHWNIVWLKFMLLMKKMHKYQSQHMSHLYIIFRVLIPLTMLQDLLALYLT